MRLPGDRPETARPVAETAPPSPATAPAAIPARPASRGATERQRDTTFHGTVWVKPRPGPRERVEARIDARIETPSRVEVRVTRYGLVRPLWKLVVWDDDGEWGTLRLKLCRVPPAKRWHWGCSARGQCHRCFLWFCYLLWVDRQEGCSECAKPQELNRPGFPGGSTV